MNDLSVRPGQTEQEQTAQGGQLAGMPEAEAASSPDLLHTSRVHGIGTSHPNLLLIPTRQQQGPANVERHKGEDSLQIHLDPDTPTRPSTSLDSCYAYPGGGGV